MSLISLDERRAAAAAKRDASCSECGGMWFELVRIQPDGTERPGQVTVTMDGDIYGYAGELRCADCGKHL